MPMAYKCILDLLPLARGRFDNRRSRVRKRRIALTTNVSENLSNNLSFRPEPCGSIIRNLCGKEIRAEFLKLLRRKSFSLANIGLPVMFYLIFGIANRRAGNGSLLVAKYLLGGNAAFGIVASALSDRGGAGHGARPGWLDLKRSSPMPPMAYLAAKCATAIAFGALIVCLLTLLGITLGGVTLIMPELARMLAYTVAGSVPMLVMSTCGRRRCTWFQRLRSIDCGPPARYPVPARATLQALPAPCLGPSR